MRENEHGQNNWGNIAATTSENSLYDVVLEGETSVPSYMFVRVEDIVVMVPLSADGSPVDHLADD